MPPRQSPSIRRPFTPPNDANTYRDLLRFEERLKSNAANLQRRKARYQLFLFQLLVVIVFLLFEVVLPPQHSLLAVPYKLILQRLFPDIYADNTEVALHPYYASGLLFVSVTTLLLFFASKMYSEKIAYANKYVPHANRALRSFNMYLNVRKPPLRSKLKWNPLSFFFPRPREQTPPMPSSPRSRSPSPTGTRPRSASTTRPIHTIPPARNPRGELIFSSRVDKNFRESYERYRAAFERMREEKEYSEWKKTWYGKLFFWERPPTPFNVNGPQHPPPPSRTASSSSRGRGSRSGTPPSAPATPEHRTVVAKEGVQSGSPMRRLSPTSPTRDKTRRERVEPGVNELDTNLRTAVLEKTFGQASIF